jgi:hypothetical protein
MKKSIIKFTFSVLEVIGSATSATAADYHLEGEVSGVRSGGPTCYIAIDDTSRNDGYSNAWHITAHDNICAIGKLAFVTGQKVRADMVRVQGVDLTNTVDGIQITTKPVIWPPYPATL